MAIANEFNFIHKDLSDTDRELFFGPLTEQDEFILIDSTWTLAHIAHAIGMFPSVNQARKNGFNKPLDSGFSQHVLSKQKRLVSILNWFEE